ADETYRNLVQDKKREKEGLNLPQTRLPGSPRGHLAHGEALPSSSAILPLSAYPAGPSTRGPCTAAARRRGARGSLEATVLVRPLARSGGSTPRIVQCCCEGGRRRCPSASAGPGNEFQ
ncbi:unnamed protein product, partial [Prorocentrum cordatum]